MELKQHLSVKSDFSLGESTLKISDIVDTASKLGLTHVALVDIMTISSMVEFANRAKKKGIKPIVGCTVRVYDDPKYRKPSKSSGEIEKINRSYNLKVYVHDDIGLKSLLRLLSKGNSAEYFYYHSRVGLDDVMELENVSITTGDIFNVFHHPDHKEIIARLTSKFSTYVEIVPIHTPLFDTLNRKALDVHVSLNTSIIGAYPAHYRNAQQADSADVLRAIATNTKLSEPHLPIPYIRDYCLDSDKPLTQRLEETFTRFGMTNAPLMVDACVAGMERIVDDCTYEFEKMPPCLPKMATDEFAALMTEVKKGWVERFSKPIMGYQPTPEQLDKEYKPRLAYELSVLRKMGFSGYFLLVQDVVCWSKSNKIMAGPGRGSSAGSLVAYLLGITDADPIRFGLMFERFINPSRIDLPDADLDFMSSRRQEIISYLTDKYGEDKVAGVSNYVTLGAASSIRNVGRMHELNPFDYACSKQVEREHGVALTLEESAESVPDISKFKNEYPSIWAHSVNLEGAMSGLGQHAAGIVIADEPLMNRAVVETRSGGPVVNWNKQYVEDFGLIKMDILGLSTLDIIRLAQDYIQERHGREIDLLSIPLDDPQVLDAFAKGKTVGVFQLEGRGMTRVLQELAASASLTFEDIAATTAMYRPGPIDAGFVDQYIAVKQGLSQPYYEHPLMEPALKDTCGVMIFQEQVMQICRDLAGFSLTDADFVRRAMGKKDQEKMAEWEVPFVAGAVKSGMIEEAAKALWLKIAGFASYGFNRSHAIVYTILSYWMMWIKVHYTAEFFAATMSIVDKEEKVSSLVIDARACGMKIFPPDINRSSEKIEIVGTDKMYMPFQAVKGISSNVARHIMNAKQHYGKPFESPEEFFAALKDLGITGKVNKAHRERLDKIGAFAAIQPGAKPALHPERLRDQLELLPGFAVDAVKAERTIPLDKEVITEILKIAEETRSCDKCGLCGTEHVAPRMGKTPKFMVVFDAPSWKEAKSGKMLEGDAADYFKAALKDMGLSANDGYYTALVKAPKPQGAKSLSNESITACSDYLKREIDLLKPPVIIAMGSNAIRYFAPTLKGPSSELLGKVIYDQSIDASIILGFNPAQIVFDPSKVGMLRTVTEKIVELVS